MFRTYPFLTYGLIVWGNTYSTTLQPLSIMQKKGHADHGFFQI